MTRFFNKLISRSFLVLACFLSPQVFAQEAILSYHSDIEIVEDGSINVAENIRVRAEGISIRSGIYRDFPTRYEDQLGNAYIVDFDVLQVTRDGAEIPWSTENRSNGVRVYAGSADVPIAPGVYDFTIAYRTNRQLGFFEEHDEFYWSVTGNSWDFPITQASATVQLPEGIPASSITIKGYTGAFGSSGQNYSAEVADGSASINSTRPLLPREGLTLSVSWPKGVIVEPSSAQELGFLLSDNIGLLLAIITLLAAACYLYIMWSKVGVDPKAGVIFPHYNPPAGYSPASTRYVSKMAYDNVTLTAAIINLAVNGHLTITKEGKTYFLRRAESTKPLAAGEQVLLGYLFVRGDELELNNDNRSIITEAISRHKKSLRRNYLNIYFKKNSDVVLPSAVGSILMLLVILASEAGSAFVVIAFGLNTLVHILFLYLMQAPSTKGRLLLDKLEGFKLYLEVAEKDDLNLRNAPDKTPELFEKYLPFAVALGVENAWSEQFTSVFAALSTEKNVAYHPAWYHGAFHASQLNSFTQDVGSSFNSAISSASVPPGSTSGMGGGGFSGGGGGGGGGGGF